MIEKIEYEGKILALILRSGYERDGVNFITPEDNPLQLGVLKHKQGAKIKPHTHRNRTRAISEVQEVLYVQYGEVEAEFYDAQGSKLGSAVLNAGDTILLLSGGHGFNILKDSKIIEIKQGPYYGVGEDKEVLNITM